MKTRGLPFTADSILALMTCAQCGTLSPGVCPECGSAEKVKWQTRRVVKPQPPKTGHNSGRLLDVVPSSLGWGWDARYEMDNPIHIGEAPYQPGDIVWARETWRTLSTGPVRRDGQLHPLKYFDDMPPRDLPTDARLWYEADGAAGSMWGRYRHARFMPRWAARIWREVVEVRAEWLQDITEEDAIAEGVKPWRPDHEPERSIDARLRAKRGWSAEGSYYTGFRELWDSLLAKRKGGIYTWDKNPVVFAYRLKVSTADHRGTETQRGNRHGVAFG